MSTLKVTFDFNELKAQGMSSLDAMEHAAEKRMRPMLMTATVQSRPRTPHPEH